MFTEKLETLLGLIYRQVPANTCVLPAKAEASTAPDNAGTTMASEDMNGLFVKDIAPKKLPDTKRRITAIEIYMLCPQLNATYHDSDVERFISWFSKLQMNSQLEKRMESKYRPPYIEEKPEGGDTTGDYHYTD
jgi:hypothetical protein